MRAHLWAVQQLATLRLPDQRLAVRAVRFLAHKALRPADSVLQGAEPLAFGLIEAPSCTLGLADFQSAATALHTST